MKTKNIFLTVALALSTTFAFAQITGSAHDFKALAWNATGEICVTCHTPHNANAAIGAPLWNRTASVAGYTAYSGGASFDASATITAPSGTSKLCLSCHDGTVNLSAFTGGSALTTKIGTGLLGTDLSTHHPVSFTYDNALFLADPGLYDPAAVTTVSDLLFAGKVECASCHDAHNAGTAKLLRMTNAASALCLTCHNK